MHHPDSTFVRDSPPLQSLLRWLDTINSHTAWQQMPNMPHSTASSITCLSSERHNWESQIKAISKWLQQPDKRLNKGEKPYRALCEDIMHFGVLKSNSSALAKTFLERQGSNFYSFFDEGQTKEKYSRLAIYYMQNQSLQQSEISSNRIFSYLLSIMLNWLCTNCTIVQMLTDYVQMQRHHKERNKTKCCITRIT